jgi:dolichol kinase
MTGETKRQLEHILPLGFVFLLPWLSLTQAVLACVGAAVYGLFVSARVNRAGVRDNEKKRGWSVGKLSYAIVVLALVLLFRERIHIACGGWAVLALGDSISNIAGRAWGRAKVPWSAKCTWVGSGFYVLASWIGSLFFVCWAVSVSGYVLPSFNTVVVVCLGASVVAALVETLPLPIDDNLTSPLAAAAVLAVFL